MDSVLCEMWYGTRSLADIMSYRLTALGDISLTTPLIFYSAIVLFETLVTMLSYFRQ